MKTWTTLLTVLTVGVGVSSWGFAQAWTPYEPVKGHPHVLKGEEWGTYLPEPGWQFVEKGGESLSVIPIPAKEITVNTGGDPITIPAPRGFWTPEKGSVFEKVLKIQQSADNSNKTLGTWIRINSVDYTNTQEATVTIQHRANGTIFSLAAFEEMRKMMVREVEKIVEENRERLGKTVKESSQKVSEKIGAEYDLTILNLKALPPHINERDRIGTTLVRKAQEVTAEGTLTNYAVINTMVLWVRGTVITLGISKATYVPSEVKDIVKETRAALNEWVNEIDRINNRTSLEDENAIALADPGCVKAGADKNTEIDWGKVMAPIYGGVILALVSLFLNRKDAMKKLREWLLN